MQLENVADLYPLSSTQVGMLFHCAAAPNSGVYIAQLGCLLSGNLNLDLFKTAWQQVLQRHTALRTAFLWDGLDEPLQVVRGRVEPSWQVLDWRGHQEQEAQAALDRLLEADRRKGFDLADAPLMRMLLVRLKDRSHRFVWTCHHLLADGWSSAVVLREVFAIYEAERAGRARELPPPLEYRDYIAWLQGRNLEASEPFWRSYLAGFSVPTSLQTPTPPERGGEVPLHRAIELRLSAKASASLRRAARELRLTLNALLQGAWAVLLNRYSGESDLVYGTTVAARPTDLEGIEDAVGLFINTLPVRTRVEDAQPLGDWLQQLQQNLLGARQHVHTPLVRIQEWSDLPAREALFDTILVLETRPVGPDAGRGASELRIDEIRSLDQSNYALAVLAAPEEELALTLVYNPARYSDAIAGQVLSHLKNLLTAIPSCLDRPIGELEMLSDRELDRLLIEWNETAAEIPRDRCVLDLFSEQVARAPDACALQHRAERLTYADLDARSSDWARRLILVGAAAGQPVALCLERGLDLITGILAILKAGGAYVPIDPGYPRYRLELLARASGARVLLISRDLADELSALDLEALCLEDLGSRFPDGTADAVLPRVQTASAAYVIFTSGSTGTPKGVVINHRNLIASTLARRSYYPERPSVFLLLPSVAFDSSVAGIFWALSTGARLLVSEHRIEQDLGRLAACIAEQEVTHTLCLPTVYEMLLRYAEPGLLERLRTVIVAGEACPTGLVELHRRVLPRTALYNEYGPTEATVWCSVYDTSGHDPDQPVPIGRPIQNAQIYILDGQRRPLPVGVCGEIHVGGAGLSEGYINQAEATAERFPTIRLRDREVRLYRTGDLGRYLPDGNIEFLGREDRQIKVRGYRIEPAEIEAALCRHPGVREAVVMPVGDTGGSSAADGLSDADTEGLGRRLLSLGENLADDLLAEIGGLTDEEASGRIAEAQGINLNLETVVDRSEQQPIDCVGFDNAPRSGSPVG